MRFKTYKFILFYLPTISQLDSVLHHFCLLEVLGAFSQPEIREVSIMPIQVNLKPTVFDFVTCVLKNSRNTLIHTFCYKLGIFSVRKWKLNIHFLFYFIPSNFIVFSGLSFFLE